MQEFKLRQDSFGLSPSVKWMDTSNELILVPDKRSISDPKPPNVLVIDLETRQSHWQSTGEVNIDRAITIRYSRTGYREAIDDFSTYYAFPSKQGSRVESSFIGFSLPILSFKIPWFFSEGSGWEWKKTYFGWVRLTIREAKSDPVVVINQIVINASHELVGIFDSAWVLEGKFLIFEPYIGIDRRVLALGPFNTSQHTQSTDNKNKEYFMKKYKLYGLLLALFVLIALPVGA